VYFFESGKTLRRRHTLRREREVLGGGQLKLSWEERKAFLEEEWGEPVREACLRGVSTRPAGEVLEPVLGESSAAPTVSRIARGRDRAGERFPRGRRREAYVEVLLDGVGLKGRDLGGSVRR
jgi:transposase-like protein